ncbi:hypothetical protein Droror1_Dr00002789 [Drosera rotundifolia]
MGAFFCSVPAIIIFFSVILFVEVWVLETRVDEELDDLGLGWWICKITKQRFGSGNFTVSRLKLRCKFPLFSLLLHSFYQLHIFSFIQFATIIKREMCWISVRCVVF